MDDEHGGPIAGSLSTRPLRRQLKKGPQDVPSWQDISPENIKEPSRSGRHLGSRKSGRYSPTTGSGQRLGIANASTTTTPRSASQQPNDDPCLSILANPCSGRGLCVKRGAGFQCVCQPGFTGIKLVVSNLHISARLTSHIQLHWFGKLDSLTCLL